jgi:NRPS condensation-like uncharacterized protein
LRACLVRRPGGDSLLFSIHHAITDGIGALRLLNSVARAYTDRPDPVPPIDPLAVRDLRSHFGRTVPAAAQGADPEDKLTGPWAQIAAEGGAGAPGYGIVPILLTAEQCGTLDPRRFGPDVTLNDLLIAALHLTIALWNDRLGRPCDNIAVVLPINLRPPEWYNEVVGNLAIVDLNRTSRAQRSTPESLLAAVTAQTRRSRTDVTVVKFLTRPRWACWIISNVYMPLIINAPRWMGWMIPKHGDGPATTLFANLGRIERKVSGFGAEAGEFTEFWSSPPAWMPWGVGMTAAVLRGRVHVGMRYRRALLDDRAARRFSDLFVETLLTLG